MNTGVTVVVSTTRSALQSDAQAGLNPYGWVGGL